MNRHFSRVLTASLCSLTICTAIADPSDGIVVEVGPSRKSDLPPAKSTKHSRTPRPTASPRPVADIQVTPTSGATFDAAGFQDAIQRGDKDRALRHVYEAKSFSTTSGNADSAKSRHDALNDAAEMDNPELLKAIITSGANVNTEDSRSPTTPLQSACMRSSLSSVEQLLKAGARVDQVGKTGQPPLTIAAGQGNTKIVKLLLMHGANVNGKGKAQEQAIIAAAERRHTETVAVLLQAGADPNARDFHRTALMAASSSLECTKLLIKAGARVNDKSGYGETALDLAVRASKRDVAEFLVASGATASASKSAMSTAAGAAGSAEMTSVLIEAGANVNQRGVHEKTPLMEALEGKHKETALKLLEKGASVSAGNRNRTPLIIAAETNQDDMIAELVRRGADPNSRDESGRTPLMAACERNSSAAVRQLIQAGSQVNAGDKDNRTALMRAVGGGRIEIVQALLAAGADPNALDSRGNTALGAARFNSPSYTEIARMLIKAGAKVHHQNRSDTLLAESSQNPELQKLILDAGANPNEKAKNGDTPLCTACSSRGTVESVRQLLERGADANLPGARGLTPLIAACSASQGPMVLEKVKLLLAKGADINKRNDEHGTALMAAAASDQVELYKFLLQSGADPGARNSRGQTAVMLGNAGIVSATPPEQLRKLTSSEATNLVQHLLSEGGSAGVQALLAAGVTINDQARSFDDSILEKASARGDVDLVKNLLRAGVKDRDGGRQSALHAAVGHSSDKGKEVVNTLLAEGSNVNVRDQEDKTPLMIAAGNADTATVGLLLSKGASVNARDREGCDALWYACSRGGHSADSDSQYKTIQLLLEAGGKADTRSNKNASALLGAAAAGNLPAVQELIRAGADVNAATDDPLSQYAGVTPLMAAARSHSRKGEGIQIVRVLLAAGARVNAVDKEYNSALGFAAQQDNAEIVSALIEAGADVNLRNDHKKTPLGQAQHAPKASAILKAAGGRM